MSQLGRKMLGLLSCCVLAACTGESRNDSQDFIVSEGNHTVEVRSKDGSLSLKGNESTGSLKIRTDEGQSIEVSYSKDKLAENFPADIPTYASSTVSMSQVFNKGRNAVATFTSGHDAPKITAFFTKALPDKGWVLQEPLTFGDMTLLQGMKNGLTLTVSVIPADNETTIAIAMTDQEERSP